MTLVIRMMALGLRMRSMKLPTVAYRIHQNSISRSDEMDERREKEAFRVFKKYRSHHLNIFNPLDLSVYYETWLRFKYKGDRKSTRLNSSHVRTSYAVFCLKKKKHHTARAERRPTDD